MAVFEGKTLFYHFLAHFKMRRQTVHMQFSIEIMSTYFIKKCGFTINSFLFTLFLLLIIPQAHPQNRTFNRNLKLTSIQLAQATSTPTNAYKINNSNNNDSNSTTVALHQASSATTSNASTSSNTEFLLNLVKSNFNSQQQNSNGTRPKSRPGQQREHMHYKTTYACEGNQLELSCQDGKLIHLVRANYGRFSLSICNELGHSNLSVQCASFRAFLLMEARCNKLSNCSVIVSKGLFGDPCEGTSKYLEVQYYCDDGNNQQNNKILPDNSSSSKEQTAPNKSPQPSLVVPSNQVGGSQSASEQRDEPSQQQQQQQQQASNPIVGQQQQNPSIISEQQPFLGGSSTSVIQQQFCLPQTSSRKMHWNYTRAGLVVRQSCPDGSSGKASWYCDSERLRFMPQWSPDFTQCRSNWLQRLAHQLDQMLEQNPGASGNKAAAVSLDWQRQQNEQMLKVILNDLTLMASTKELFSEDLKRIDIMISQIIAQLRSMAVLATGSGWRQTGSGGQFAPMYEELFSKLVGIVSSLFDISQRSAWLDIQPLEMRRKLEQRYLNHLKEAGILLAQSMEATQLEQLAPFKQANVFAGITVINGARLLSLNNNNNNNNGDFESNEFNLQLKQSQSILSRFVTDPDDQINELKIHTSILRELVANGITRFLVLDIKKPDYSLIRHQLEQQATNSYASAAAASGNGDSNLDSFNSNQLFGDQQWSSRVFGVFAILGENGDVLDGTNANLANQQENKLNDLLAQWPISVDFKVSSNQAQPLRQCSSAVVAAAANDMLSSQQQNRCQTIRSNATNHICRCDQFGFIALTSSFQQQQQVDQQQQQVPINNLDNQFQWPPPSSLGIIPSSSPGQQPIQPLIGTDFDNLLSSRDSSSTSSSSSGQQEKLSIWTIIFMVLGLSVFIVSLATFVINAIVRATSLNKKPAGFLSTSTSILQHHHRDVSGGPTTGPLSATADQQLTNSTNTQSSGSIIGLSTSGSSGGGGGGNTTCNQHPYKTHQQLYAAHYPTIDCVTSRPMTTSWFNWRRWLRTSPARWLAPSFVSSAKHTEDQIQHRIVGSHLANGGLLSSNSAYKNHFQNGYTTNLHHQHHLLHHQPVVGATAIANSLPLAAPSSASSYVSSSAYYEEIGPGNLTKVNTSQLTSNSTHTIVDPFKRQQADQQHLITSNLQQQQQRPQTHQTWSSYPAQQEALHTQINSQYDPVINGNQINNNKLTLHSDLSQLQSSASSNSNNNNGGLAQNQTSTNTTANGSSTPRHYLFASPSAVNAYKSSMSQQQHQQTLHHQQQQQHHLHQQIQQQQQFQQQQQQQQRFMPSG